MAKLTLEIVSPERRILSTPADEVIAPAAEGLYGVRPGHSAFLSTIKPGTLTVREGGNTQLFFVAGGFLEVNGDKVLVLADHAEPLAGIDAAAAARRLEEAQKRLQALGADDPARPSEVAAVERETARVAAARARP